MNSLLVAHPEIRKEIRYKQENVTNISMFQMLILKLFRTSPKISWNDTGLFHTLRLGSDSSKILHQKLSHEDSKVSEGERDY